MRGQRCSLAHIYMYVEHFMHDFYFEGKEPMKFYESLTSLTFTQLKFFYLQLCLDMSLRAL